MIVMLRTGENLVVLLFVKRSTTLQWRSLSIAGMDQTSMPALF